MRIRDILIEYDRGITLRTIEQKLFARMTNDELAPDSIDEIMEMIESVDPSPTNTYTPWLVNQYIKNSFDISDLASVKLIMSRYIAVKKFIPPHDIGTLSFDQITDMTKAGESKQLAPLDIIPDTKVLYNGPQGQLAIPKTMEASIALGEGTVWCTAWDPKRGNRFNYYNSTGDLYVWRDAKRKDKKYQFYWGDAVQFMDRANDTISEKDMKYFREINPITAPIFAKEEEKIIQARDFDKLKQILAIFKGRNIVWEEGNELVKDAPAFDVIPDTIVLYNEIDGQLAIPETEEASIELGADTNWDIAYTSENGDEYDEDGDKRTNAFSAYATTGTVYVWRDGLNHDEKYLFYWGGADFTFLTNNSRPISSQDMIYFRERNPVTASIFNQEEEKVIQSNTAYKIINLARELIKSNTRSANIEKWVIQNAKTAFEYTFFILHKRWPEAEPIIATDPEHAALYAERIINNNNKGKPIRWREAEDVIATNPISASSYAIRIIQDRWPEAEAVIAKNAFAASNYDSAFGTNLSQQ